jgi:hypothetical protein
MIAIAIFSLVLGVIYSTWMLIMRAARVGQAAAAQVQRQRIAIQTIEDGLTCIQSFQASMKYYAFVVDNGDPPLLSFAARVPADFPRNGKFGDFNVRRLTFSVETDNNGDKRLVLRQNPILMDLGEDEQKSPLVLARNVQKFAVECWGTNVEDNAAEWVDEWDNTNAIPQLIRVTLVLGGDRNNDNFAGSAPVLSVTRVISVPSLMMPAMAQGAGGGPGFGPGGGIRLVPPTLNRGGNPNPQPPPNGPFKHP